LQTLTVTTNAAGQAAASGLNAVTSGAFQIQVQAAYQGQVATAAISQTNFATAAAATQAGAGAGGGGTASGATGGAAGGGGGGLSATTIGIIGAAVGGGALAATQVVGKGSDEESFDGYNGSLSGQLVLISASTDPQGQPSNCTRNHSVSGPLTIELFEGNATGRASGQIALTELSVGGTCIPSTQPITFSFQRENTPVSGGPSALTFRSVQTFVNGTTYTVMFTGSHSGNTITGSVGIVVATPAGASPPNLSGSTSFPITLTGPRP
jgi:hypothetical protein